MAMSEVEGQSGVFDVSSSHVSRSYFVVFIWNMHDVPVLFCGGKENYDSSLPTIVFQDMLIENPQIIHSISTPFGER